MKLVKLHEGIYYRDSSKDKYKTVRRYLIFKTTVKTYHHPYEIRKGKALYINPKKVTFVESIYDEKATQIHAEQKWIEVYEPLEEVINKLRE